MTNHATPSFHQTLSFRAERPSFFLRAVFARWAAQSRNLSSLHDQAITEIRSTQTLSFRAAVADSESVFEF